MINNSFGVNMQRSDMIKWEDLEKVWYINVGEKLLTFMGVICWNGTHFISLVISVDSEVLVGYVIMDIRAVKDF